MQNCLGLYIEDNLIKYAKVSKDKTNYKVENFGLKFIEGNIAEKIKKIIEETYSYNVPLTINLANEKYLYFDVFSLLKENDIQKAIQTEFEAFCDENKYNQNAFETRHTLVNNVEDSEKYRAIQVIINKIELNKQKQYAEGGSLQKIFPIGSAITTIAKLEKKENAIIVNLEGKTTITTVYNRQIYEVETFDFGSQEVLEKINRIENSLNKAYEICKNTTIYTSNVIDDTKEQPYLEYIIPTLYEVNQKLQEIIEKSPQRIGTVYLTGTLSAVNNIDLYFQEFLGSIDCKILRPNIIEEGSTQINIKDYIEVNSAIALAMQGLGAGIQSLNFKKLSLKEHAKKIFTIELSPKGKKTNQNKKIDLSKKIKEGPKIDFSFKGDFTRTEVACIRFIAAILLINIIFMVFSKILFGQLEEKQKSVEELISSENKEISKIKSDTASLDSKKNRYDALTEELKSMNDKISYIAQRKNSIPNLLNQLMYIIPETVELTSIENTTGDKIVIIAQDSNYEHLGYFIARIKLEGYLKNVVTSSGQKNGSIVSVTIEGDLP